MTPLANDFVNSFITRCVISRRFKPGVEYIQEKSFIRCDTCKKSQKYLEFLPGEKVECERCFAKRLRQNLTLKLNHKGI